MPKMIPHDSQDNPNLPKHKPGEICEKSAIYFQYRTAPMDSSCADYTGSKYDKNVTKGDPFPPSKPSSECPDKHYHYKEESSYEKIRKRKSLRELFKGIAGSFNSYGIGY